MTPRRLASAGELPGGLTRERACELLAVPRSSSYRPLPEARDAWSEEDEALAREIDRLHLEWPQYGARKIARVLSSEGVPNATRWRVTRLMRMMGIRPLCPLPSLSGPAAHRPGFPYLLAGKEISFPNQVWSTDITYVQIGGRHMYLTAVIDWYSRYVVAWRLSDTMRACEGVACSEQAYAAHGTPAIQNSDQGSVFSSAEYVSMLSSRGIRQSMDGRRRWADNVIVERWFRTLKSECLRNSEYETPAQLRAIIGDFVERYNGGRVHQALGYQTPSDWYFSGVAEAA